MVINKGTQDILKLEVVFFAGRPFEQKRLVSRATCGLLKEGTKNYTSAQIAEKVDFYGGTLSTPFGLDTSNIILYSLTRHFEKLLPLLAEVILEPSFPEEELSTFIENSKHRLQIDLSKTDVVAYRKVTEVIFGEDHPYGYNSFPETYDQLTREDLIQHYQKNYSSKNCTIFLSGKVTSKEIALVNKFLGQEMNSSEKPSPIFETTYDLPQKIKITHSDSVQTAIRIGCQLFTRNHPDYDGWFVLNTILGGYFGSRLMANIREDKGYTYNIFSTMDTMHYGGCFYIGTEVGNDLVDVTLKEIYHEMNLLQKELVEADELSMVKNYLLGNMLTMLDGPFNIIDIIKTTALEELPESSFSDLVESIKKITPEKIQSLAKKYLGQEKMWEVVVGC
jgi:predicted Zn-dependent peptidase